MAEKILCRRSPFAPRQVVDRILGRFIATFIGPEILPASERQIYAQHVGQNQDDRQ